MFTAPSLVLRPEVKAVNVGREEWSRFEVSSLVIPDVRRQLSRSQTEFLFS